MKSLFFIVIVYIIILKPARNFKFY
jgi:hypothetical protein